MHTALCADGTPPHLRRMPDMTRRLALRAAAVAPASLTLPARAAPAVPAG
jgi:hypothetical protein